MKTESKLDEFVHRRGRSVSMGTSEKGLTRADAIAALEIAKAESCAIIGGDVYLQQKAQIQSALANWHVERRSGESFAAYVVRSLEEAADYITRYPEPTDGTPLFVLVGAGS